MLAAFWLALTWVATATADTPAAAPVAPWDGLEELRVVAAQDGIELVVAESQSLSALQATDALLLVGPRMQMPVPEVAAFLREGGRVALLDDIGSGARMLATYQVQRERPPTGAPTLRGNRDLLLAFPAIEHPLTEGVPVLLTNRAVALAHPDLKPVFTFGAGGPALVLSGAVGPGRLVIVGDASVLINQLMALPSHRRFAHNLLAYMARPGGRVFLVGPQTVLRGQFGTADGDRRHDWNDALRRISHPQLPGLALGWVGFAVALLSALLALVLLPRKSPYARHALVDALSTPSRSATRPSSLGPAPMVREAQELRDEVFAELRTRLSLPLRGNESSDEVLQQVRRLGLPPEDTLAWTDLLQNLSKLGTGAASPFRRRMLGNDLANTMQLAESLLAKIGRDSR